jgi:hypothetical protein
LVKHDLWHDDGQHRGAGAGEHTLGEQDLVVLRNCYQAAADNHQGERRQYLSPVAHAGDQPAAGQRNGDPRERVRPEAT